MNQGDMMTDTRYRLPSEVAKQLQLSPSTLRRWSNEFSDYLTDAAGRPQSVSGGQTAHRRYTDEDLETLMTIKGLLAEGLTYIQVGKRLEALRMRQGADEETADEGEEQVTALGPSLMDTSRIGPAVTVLADTLHTVADGQQLLLGSQQASRDLLSVVVQDNFSLKEENAKLRDRMLELERELAEIRRLDQAKRDAVEARLRKLETRAPKPAPTTNVQQSSQRSGCLSQLFG
jgi:DNA-binding transcriptional MerR regulator